MPEGWAWTKIHCVSSEILYGVSESAKETGKYKLLRITDIQDDQVNWDSVPFIDFPEDKVSNYILKNGDIVFARTGATVGKSYLIENLNIESIYASYLIRIRTSLLLNPRYMKYYFGSLTYWNQITDKSSGIGQPNVNGTSLANLYIPIPPYNEQDRILPVIGKVFKLIDSLENDKNKLENLIKTAKSKILDLSIHGKLVPQDPNDEPAEELLKRIATSDNRPYEKFKESEKLFEAPENWSWCYLKETCTDFIVPQRDKPKVFDGTIPWCRIEDIEGKYLNGSLSNQLVSKDTIKQMNMHICPVGSVICSCSASLGIQAITTIECCTNQTFIGIVPIESVLYNEYLFYYLKAQTKYFHKIATGTTIKYISRDKFEELPFALPPFEEQKRIVSKIENLFTVLDEVVLNLV